MAKVAVSLLFLLATVLLGTVVVLSTVQSFFGVDWTDAIAETELAYFRNTPSLPYNASVAGTWTEIDGVRYEYERIPRILHQTWKSDTLPERWAGFSAQCREMHPDYEYMLWTDASSKSFIAEHYSWFLPTFEAYPHNIQRADAIRYFVLHKYGGVYLDLDIGCRRPVDPLLHFPYILPATKPVGVSNDLMFAVPQSPFMDTVIHNLMAFDHTYLSAYPTVMFSTGPMFLSAILSLWNSKEGTEQVRILPQSFYGKNIDPKDAPSSFFWHYYGSSWHANDSGIFTFLGQFGTLIMNIAYVVVVLGALRLIWSYRFTLLSKCFTRPASPRSGAISLPFHGQEADLEALLCPPTPTSRSRTPLSRSHSRNGSTASYATSRPGSPPPRLSFSSARSSFDSNAHGHRHTASGSAALGQRGGLFFLPLWYPTSPLPSPNGDLPPPPAYRPPTPPPMTRDSETGWSSYLPWNMGSSSNQARERTVNANPGSDVDALSLHSVKVGRS